VAELLNNKVTGGTKDCNYVFDMLVADGIYLIGKTFEDRQRQLGALFGDHITDDDYSHFIIDRHLWLAKPFRDGLTNLWWDIKERGNPEDEGLVLKKMDAKLKMCGSQHANDGWMVKCRFSHKNYKW
jgi:ATP-dependent DNA ligase